MPEKIRPINDKDLENISLLFNRKKSVEELKWVLQDQNDIQKLNAFISTNEKNEIVGFIGFEISNYFYQNKGYSAASGISWKVADDYKGFAGIQLFKKVLDLGDFGLAIQGSELGQSLYHGFKLIRVHTAYTYIKLVRPIRYFNSLQKKSFLSRLGNFAIVLPGIFRNEKTNLCQLSVKLISRELICKDIPLVHESTFEKKMTINYLKWLASCPIHDNYVFEVSNNSGFIGYCVCYIQKNYRSAPRGRIVYMPNMGSNERIWSELIGYLLDFMKNKGCCSVGALGSNRPIMKVLAKHGFINYNNKQKPVYIRDSKNILTGVDLGSWYIQYTEGDKTYRDL